MEDTEDCFPQKDQCIIVTLTNQSIVLVTRNHYQKRKRIKFSKQPQSASIMAIAFNITTRHYKHFLIAKRIQFANFTKHFYATTLSQWTYPLNYPNTQQNFQDTTHIKRAQWKPE